MTDQVLNKRVNEFWRENNVDVSMIEVFDWLT
jgi:hypothetical protein